MTRGQIAIIKKYYGKNIILTSIEFNGDMYMPTKKWAGHGQQVINALRKVDDTAAYQLAVARFNYNYHHYNDCDSLTHIQDIQALDFTKDYFDYWFSDYVYIKNITTDTVKLVTCVTDDIGKDIGTKDVDLAPNQIAVICFGTLVKVTE